MCISINERPARTQCTAYKTGATNKKVNSIGSVTPVITEVNAAESKRPLTTFFLLLFANLYIAKDAPGSPKIIIGKKVKFFKNY